MARASGIVALLTDYGLQDPYVGILKGALLSVHPKARIVDLTHEIPPQDVREGRRVLEAAVPYFPKGTVFVAVVDPGVGTDRSILAVETDRYFFLAPDNGLLGFLRGERRIRKIVEVREARYFRQPVSKTFHGRDIFAPVAARIAGGLDLGRLGPRARSLPGIDVDTPAPDGRGVDGRVVSVDRFGNLITDIPVSSLPADRIRITVGRRTLRSLSRTYADAKKGELIALVGSTGHLEISVNQGSASRVTRLKKGTLVRVRSS
jgi:S-adenosylmethionine hydrolase